MANVRDLLIRMSLDTATFKRNIADAKGELRTLKSEFRAVSSDSNVENAGTKLLENLREQKSTAEALVKEYEKGLREVRTKLNEVPAGSQAASQLQQQVTKLETGLANAKTSVNEIQTKIDTFRLENLASAAETVASIFSSLRLGFGELLSGFGETADSADQVFVNRESAWVGVTKILNDRAEYTEAWGEALNQWNREVVTRIPVAYEALAEIEANALQAAGVSMQGLREFTETYAALQSATNIQGEEGVLNFGKYLTVMNAAEDEYHRLGSVVVAMGNNFASLEDQIVATAKRSGSAMRAAGITAQDGLAIATAATAMGMEEAAAATSMEKVIGRSAKAAELGAGKYQQLLAAIQKYDKFAGSVYEFQINTDIDKKKEAFTSVMNELMLDKADLQKLVNNAITLEKYSGIMGLTPEEFGQAWSEDAAKTVIAFFDKLGSMDRGSFESMYQGVAGLGDVANEDAKQVESGILTLLDSLGITEVRAARLARNFALNSEELNRAVDIARQAYSEDKALDEEAQRRYATTESQRTMNRSKEQNALEAMGQTVTAMRKPWETFFADLKQWFTEWPDWAQAGISAGTEALGKAGDLLDALGKFSFNLMNIATAIKEIEKTTIGARILKTLGAAGSAAAAALPAVGLAGGTIALGVKLDEISTEKNWGEYNRVQEQLPQLMAEVADEKTARMQAILDSFSQAMKDTENIEPGEDRLGPVKDMFRRYANELLQEMPDLKFWDTASFYADLSDGLNEAEIEKIIQGMEFAAQWEDLGNEAVTSLAKAIEDRKAELAQSALDMGLQVDAGLAQGIYDGADQVLEAASWLAGQVEEQMRVDLDVHSPSRKMEVLGGYVAQGFARGIENGLARIEGAADRMANVMERSSSGASRAMPTAGNGRGGAAFVINIDGKAFAQAIAHYVDDALGEAAWP